MFNFVTTVLPKLTKELPRPFKMVGMERDDDTPQHKAVREAMTNCIIHADLMLNSVLKVEKYDNKFVFTNPGLLRLPVEQIYAGAETRARNQRIQNMFRMIGFGENLGSGFPLILSAWNEKHWLKPELIEQRELMQVKLVLTIETKDATANATVKLSKTQKKILPILQTNKYATYDEIAKQLDVERTTVWRNLDTMKKKNVIKRIGGDKDGYWEVLLDIKDIDK